MRKIGNLRAYHLGRSRTCEVQELVELVRGDVVDDAAEAPVLEEPRRTRWRVQTMRSESDRLQRPPDCAAIDHQLAGADRRRVLMALAERHREDAPRFLLHTPRLGQLLQR